MTLPSAQQVRDVLASALSEWAVLEVRGEQARVRRVPHLATLISRFETLFGLAWSLEWQCYGTQPYVVRAAFATQGLRREALGEAATLQGAQQLALEQLLAAFGASGSEEQWVDYDPEEGPNTEELPYLPAGAVSTLPGYAPDAAPGLAHSAFIQSASTQSALAQAPASDTSSHIGSAPPADPQMTKAREHIDRLMEELRGAGRGKAAARIIMQHGGYGKDLDDSRAIYKELQGLQKL